MFVNLYLNPSFDKYKIPLKYVRKLTSKMYIFHATSHFLFSQLSELHLNLYPLLSFYSLFVSHVFSSIKCYYLFSLCCHTFTKLPSSSCVPTFEIMPIDFITWDSSPVCSVTAVSLYFILFENYPLDFKWNY